MKVPKELLRALPLDRRRAHLRPARGRDRGQPRRPLPRDGDRPPLPLPGHQGHRLRRLRRGRRPAAGGRGGGAPPALRRGRPARGLPGHGAAASRPAGRGDEASRTAQVYEVGGLLGLDDLCGHLVASRVQRAALPALAGRHPAAARRASRPIARSTSWRRCARATSSSTTPTTPSRHGRALRPPGGRGPERAGDQADGLPDQRRLAAGAGADRGHGARQAGGLHGRAEGALRRERQHPAGRSRWRRPGSTSSTGSPG